VRTIFDNIQYVKNLANVPCCDKLPKVAPPPRDPKVGASLDEDPKTDAEDAPKPDPVPRLADPPKTGGFDPKAGGLPKAGDPPKVAGAPKPDLTGVVVPNP